MAKEPTEAKLKLIHLVYGLFAAAVCIGIAIGAMGRQQTVNTDNIEQKVEKDVFDRHETEQLRHYDKIDKGMERMEDKLDKIAEKL